MRAGKMQKMVWLEDHRIMHFDFFFVSRGFGLMTALPKKSACMEHTPCFGLVAYVMASSNTFFKFRCVRAEHSRYFTALISFATWTACSYCIGAIFRCRSCSRTSGSSLRSSFVPTRMIGTLGAWCSISGYHCTCFHQQAVFTASLARYVPSL